MMRSLARPLAGRALGAGRGARSKPIEDPRRRSYEGAAVLVADVEA